MSKIIMRPGIPPLNSPEFKTWLKIFHAQHNGGRPPTLAETWRLLKWHLSRRRKLTR